MQTKTMRLVQDWQAIHAKIQRFDWAEDIINRTKTDTDWWVANYQDDASRIAGWGHNYFCASCSSGLTFDRTQPEVHVCSRCGEVRTDSDVNEAWVYAYRSQAGVQVFHAAVMYNLYGDEAYLGLIRRVLTFYADHLPEFRVKAPAGFLGKFSGTNLTDAVSICWILNGMELVKEQFDAKELARYKRDFFMPMADFLYRTPGGTPNISCWMKSALGMIGLFFDERDLCKLAADSEEGITPRLQEGLLPSGFWYESSFHYHFYCIEGLTYYAAFCRLYEYDYAYFTDSIRRMYRYPVQYAFPNGQFPSPNDGWPQLSFTNYAHQYEWIRNVYDEPAYRYALAQCYDDPHAETEGDRFTNGGGLTRVLFGTDWREELERYEQQEAQMQAQGQAIEPIRPARESRCDRDVHYVFLQNEQASVFMKYGFVIREHSHSDVMNFELYLKDGLVSRDISNSGYGSDLFRDWQRRSIAHNTVMVDKLTQPNRPHGELLAFDAAANSCQVRAADVYPGWTYNRSLELRNDSLRDTFTVTPTAGDDTSGDHTFDWFFHCSGELALSLPTSPAPLPGDSDGYQLMQDVSCCTVDGDWSATWQLDGKRVTLSMAGCPGTTVYMFRGYEHRYDLQRWGVMVRRTGAEAAFEAAYNFEVNEG